MASTYFTILTKAGLAKAANCLALGIPFNVSTMGLGDGNGQPVTPNADMTALVHEVRRAPINDLLSDPASPGLFIAEQFVPADVGGFTVREMALYDENGVMLAVGNTPPTPKLDMSSGASSEQQFRFSLLLSNGENAVIMIDPSAVIATRKYVDNLGLQVDKIRNGLPYVSAESYTGANDTEILQAAVNDAISKKILFVTFNRDYNVTGTILNRQEVIFLGCHKITGPGSYRMRIVRGDERSMPELTGISGSQLPKFSSKTSPVVVVVGDSISTYQPNTIDKNSSLYHQLVLKIKQDNPKKNPVFYNRAIGGQLFKDLDAIPTGWADWYTDHGVPWLDYVSALNPDLVILSMGMNDSSGISFKALNSVITKIKAFASAPDLVMLTPMVPSTNGGGSHDAGYGSRSAQDGRDYAAGAIRAYCVKHKLPCIDVNRVFNVMRDGFDILDTYNVRLIGAAATNGAYRSSVECRNWSAKITMPNRDAYNFGGSPFSVQVGSIRTEIVFIQPHTDNTIKLTIWNILGGAVVYVPSQLIPDSPHQLSIDVYNQKIRVYLSNTSTDTMPDWVQLTVGGGLYYPAIGSYNSSYADGGMTSVDEFNYGEHVRYMPSLTNTQMWGVGDGAAGTKLPYGGNGINHPTSMGIAVFRTALDACDFSTNSVVQTFTHAQNGGYETKDGKVSRVWGLLKPTELVDRVDKHITWPVTITSGSLVFTASAGVLSTDLSDAYRVAQTILTCGLPDYEGVDVTFHNLTNTLAGRYAAWELNITY